MPPQADSLPFSGLETRSILMLCKSVLLILAGGALHCAAAEVESASQAWRIVEAKCLSCHGATDTKGHLRLDVPEARAKLALPGNPIFGEVDRSELLRRVKSEDVSYRMPKDEPALTHEEIATLQDWIVDGAEYPDSVIAKSNPLKIKAPPQSIWEKYSLQIDYAQKIHDSIGVLYLPFLVFLIFVLIAERAKRNRSTSLEAKSHWLVAWLSRFGHTEYVVVVLGSPWRRLFGSTKRSS